MTALGFVHLNDDSLEKDSIEKTVTPESYLKSSNLEYTVIKRWFLISNN